MVDVRYRPAGSTPAWLAVVSGGALAVLPAEVTPHTAEAAWRRLAQGGIAALIEALTGAFGTSLTAIPPFALVVVEDGAVRVAVRGGLDLVVESGAGAEEISGRGVSTWVERVIPGVHRVSLAVDAGIDDAGSLPLTDGIVPVSAVVVAVGAAPVAVPAAEPAVTFVPESAPEPERTPAPEPDSEPQQDPEPEPEPAVDPELPGPNGPADDETMITGIPAAPAVNETWLPTATAVPGDAEDDDLVWGETIASPRAATPPAVEPAPAVEAPDTVAAHLGDHDGETIAVADLRAMRQAEREQFESTDNVPPRRPSRGRIRLSTGRVVELERPVIIGRRPKSTRTSGADLPTLIAVDSPDQDISRSHIEIRAEGEHVLVTDLDTTNGTVLLRGGSDPVRLHPGEATMVVTGDVLDIGDGITVAFEDLP